jgi:hypothetical protein
MAIISVRKLVAMQKCDFCEREMPNHTHVCPFCGKMQMSPKEKRDQLRRVALVAILTLAIVGLAACYEYLRHGVIPHLG